MWNVKCFWNPTRTLVNNKDSQKSQHQIRLDLLSVRPLIQFKTQTDAIEIIFDIFEIIFDSILPLLIWSEDLRSKNVLKYLDISLQKSTGRPQLFNGVGSQVKSLALMIF